MMEKLYAHMCKHYQKYSLAANSLNAIAMAGFALLGVLTQYMAVVWLVLWGIVFAAMLGLGKFLDQEIDDLEKVKGHTHYVKSNDVSKE